MSDLEWSLYFGNLRSSCDSHTAQLRRATDPDWCDAANHVGTYINSVMIPRLAWNKK